MRVITGSRRGKKLLAPKGLDTRPTLDRVKQVMFDTLQFDIEGKTAVDLFAGSGQLGIEALSRGAEEAWFCDASKEAADVVRKNLTACGFEKKAQVTCNLYTECVTMIKRMGKTADIVFLDPPYHRGLIPDAMRTLTEAGVLSEEALIVCEHAADESLEIPDGFAVIKEKKCGAATLTIWKKEKK